jgi:hypothetical protein
MGGHVRARAALLALAGLLAIGPASAAAAPPLKNAEYNGRTSQGTRINVSTDRTGDIDDAETTIRLPCTASGTVRFIAFAVVVNVSPTGRFTDVDYDTGDPDFADITHDQTTGLDVTRQTFTGRFGASRRTVSGTWQLQTSILSPGTFPYDPSLLDGCDSGVVTWTATAPRSTRRARAAGPRSP